MARSLLSAIVAFALQSAHGAEWTLSGRVVALKDGDTFVMLDGKTQHPIRIAGIDAPERGQPYSNASKDNLSRLVFNRTVKARCYRRTDMPAMCAACSVTKGRTWG
jgi:endonuclease YncB( thermonuclease family)